MTLNLNDGGVSHVFNGKAKFWGVFLQMPDRKCEEETPVVVIGD